MPPKKQITLTSKERKEALTTKAPTAKELKQKYDNTERLRRVAAVLQEQKGFHEFAGLASATSGVIDRKSAQRMKKDYMKSEAYLNKVKKDSKKLWNKMNQSKLESIFKDFMIIYNNKRPEDSKLSTDPQNNSYLYFQFIKHASTDYQIPLNEIYKQLVMGDIADFEYMTTAPETAWAREEAREKGQIIKRKFLDGIENELLFYESILEAINNYISSHKIMVQDGAYRRQYYLVQNDGQPDESWKQLNSLDPKNVYIDVDGNSDVITDPLIIAELNNPRNGYRRVVVGGKKRGKKSIKNKKLKTKKRNTRRRKTRKH
jgi:hypothetical protein